MASKTLRCYAEGRDGDWEAICLDLDIAVQGTSLDAAKAALNAAIETYVEDARAETEPGRSALLNRRAPLHARIAWLWPFVVGTLFDGTRSGNSTIRYQIACRA